MKTLILKIARFIIIAMINIVLMSPAGLAQKQSNVDSSQTKQIVHIKTMKIMNGDTIVNEKSWSGDGSIDLTDSLTRNDQASFGFHFFNAPDEQFFMDFSSPAFSEMFKDFKFDDHHMIFKQMEPLRFDIDSIIKEYNFNYSDSLVLPQIDKHFFYKNFDHDSIINPKNNNRMFGNDGIQQKNMVYKKKIIVEDLLKVNAESKMSRTKETDLTVDIYPNPSDGYINVSFPLNGIRKNEISINDLNGKVMIKETIESSTGQYTRQFDLNFFEKGIYLLNIKQGKKMITKKIIIE